MKHIRDTFPVSIQCGWLLEIVIFKHMIDFHLFGDKLVFSFAWWARGDTFMLLGASFLEIYDDAIYFLKLQIAKSSISVFWNRE